MLSTLLLLLLFTLCLLCQCFYLTLVMLDLPYMPQLANVGNPYRISKLPCIITLLAKLITMLMKGKLVSRYILMLYTKSQKYNINSNTAHLCVLRTSRFHSFLDRLFCTLMLVTLIGLRIVPSMFLYIIHICWYFVLNILCLGYYKWCIQFLSSFLYFRFFDILLITEYYSLICILWNTANYMIHFEIF